MVLAAGFVTLASAGVIFLLRQRRTRTHASLITRSMDQERKYDPQVGE